MLGREHMREWIMLSEMLYRSSQSELASIRINVIHLMLAGGYDGSILPLDHTLEQSQPLANIHRLRSEMSATEYYTRPD